MKKTFAIIAACALLAACGHKKDAGAGAMASESASATATPAAVYTPAAGSYDVARPDGTKGVTTLMADGKYVDRDAHDKVTEKGTYAMKDGKICFTHDAKEECYTETTPGADGSFTATDAKGTVLQVKPHAK